VSIIEDIEISNRKLALLELNSAAFSYDDADHSKLWIGRRLLDSALEKFPNSPDILKIAILHHPLDWLNSAEASSIRAKLESRVDVILRGHLHENDAHLAINSNGNTLNLSAGACYQTRKWPNTALFNVLSGSDLEVLQKKFGLLIQQPFQMKRFIQKLLNLGP